MSRQAGKEEFGWKDKEFRFSQGKLQVVIGYRRKNVRHAVGDAGLNNGEDFWSRKVDLESCIEGLWI